MQPYLPNSPQAAARIVALATLADGHIAQGEAVVIGAVVEQWGMQRWMFQFRAKPVEGSVEYV